MALGQKSPNTKSVTRIWDDLVSKFGDEVNVLVDANFEEIKGVCEDRVSNAIEAFREGRVIIHPGGGGEYGSVEIPDRKNYAKFLKMQKKTKSGQMGISDF